MSRGSYDLSPKWRRFASFLSHAPSPCGSLGGKLLANMPSTVMSCALTGLAGRLVSVEVDIHHGLPFISIVGLPGPAVREAKDRLMAGIRNAGFKFPAGRVTFNLAPGHLPKAGSAFDLPMAIGLLVSSGQLTADLSRSLLYGEVALDGSLRSVPGVLPVAAFAARQGLAQLVVPSANAQEAAYVQGIDVVAADTLGSLVEALSSGRPLAPVQRVARQPLPDTSHLPNLAIVRGQGAARRALEIAAAGGHNLLMTGPPGSGKTLLARCLPSILPALSLDEAMTVTSIYSVAGLLPPSQPLVLSRPFRSPHHTASAAALTGGGPRPLPGEVSLAHLGVLFLDELPEFDRRVLESLRGPLEDGIVNVSRVRSSVSFPARFALVAARNPCPCGHVGDPMRACHCPPGLVERYQARVSGPLLDRFDLHVDVPRMEVADLIRPASSESSAAVAARVASARAVQRVRLGDARHPAKGAAEGIGIGDCDFTRPCTNADTADGDLRRLCAATAAAGGMLAAAVQRLGLSARGYHRVMRVSRTIADLDGSATIESEHMAEALQYRPRT